MFISRAKGLKHVIMKRLKTADKKWITVSWIVVHSVLTTTRCIYDSGRQILCKKYRWLCLYSYNKSQQDTVFLNFILVKNSISLICNNSVTTQQCHNTTVSQHNSVTTQQCHNRTLSQHKCHNSKYVIFQEKLLKVLKCYNFLWVQRRHNCSPAASFTNCVTKLITVKSAPANVSFYTNNSKMSNFELWHSRRKWAIGFGQTYCPSSGVLILYS